MWCTKEDVTPLGDSGLSQRGDIIYTNPKHILVLYCTKSTLAKIFHKILKVIVLLVQNDRILKPRGPMELIDNAEVLNNSIKECDKILELSEQRFRDVLVLGYDADTGQISARCSRGLIKNSEALYLIKQFERILLA